MDLISVIVPVYNVEKYLDRCVESIVNQTYKKLEIILIDDGSPDNCPKMCDDWAKKDSRIKVIHKENGGVSSARNCGLDEAKGEYISFVDSDDVIHSQFYEIMAKNIGDADIIYCEYKNFTNEISFDEADNFEIEVNIRNDVFLNPKFSFYIVCNKIIKYQILKDIRFDESLKNAEDTLFGFEVINKCSKVVYIKEKLYGYFVRDNSAVNSIDLKGKKDVVKVCGYMYDFISNKGNKELKNNLEVALYYDYLKLYKECKKEKQKTDDFYESKKYLKKNLFFILFVNPTITTKEKIVLLLDLCNLGGIYECWNRNINRK